MVRLLLLNTKLKATRALWTCKMNDSKVEAGKIFLDYHMEEGKKMSQFK